MNEMSASEDIRVFPLVSSFALSREANVTWCRRQTIFCRI